MPKFDKLVMGLAALALMFCLIGPATIWRMAKTVAELLLIILVFIWML